MNIGQFEEQLQSLRARRAAVEAGLDSLAPELERAEAALVEASAIFDAALSERLRTEQAAAGNTLPVEGAEWTPGRPPSEAEQRAAQEARAAWDQADEQLAAARVRHTTLQVRRSGLRMESRHLDGRIEQAEAELEQARQQPSERDLLADIRERLGLGAA
jgi:chromosome segregation ATPase